MSEKMQEWIEAVERAMVLCRDCRLDDIADLIAELAAYLRVHVVAPEPFEQFRNQLHRRMAAAAIGYFASCCYALPAPLAALATPGGEE